MCLEAYLRQACVIPLERWWIARGADTLAPFRQLALGVCYTRRESRWAGGDGGDGGGEQGAVALFPLERVPGRAHPHGDAASACPQTGQGHHKPSFG